MDVTSNTTQDPTMYTGNVQTKPRPGNLLKMKNAGAASADQIDKTSEDFEAQFISQMVGTMFNTVEEDTMTGGGQGGEMYKSFLADEYGKIIAKAGGIGISDQVKKELLRLQEAENHEPAGAK